MNVDRDETALDDEVRRYVYDYVMKEGLPPTIAETASALSTTPDNVGASFQRLAAEHILVLQRGTGEILIANPFSAVPTPFQVRQLCLGCDGNSRDVGARHHHRGFVRMLWHGDASKGDQQLARRRAGIVHFAIPAAHWWDDIVFN